MAEKDLDDFFAEIDEGRKRGKVASEEEIIKEIQAYRKGTRASGSE